MSRLRTADEKYPLMTCQECGEKVRSYHKHSYMDCIRYRWTGSPRPLADDPKAELALAERDIATLLYAIDHPG